jgi:hypothetical protein
MSVLEVRTKVGRKVVRIRGNALDRLSASERDAAERALRIWKKLPIENA